MFGLSISKAKAEVFMNFLLRKFTQKTQHIECYIHKGYISSYSEFTTLVIY